jgi:hypothetical protein
VSFTDPTPTLQFPQIAVCAYPGATLEPIACFKYNGENEAANPRQTCGFFPITPTCNDCGTTLTDCYAIRSQSGGGIVANSTGFFYAVDSYFRVPSSASAFINGAVTAFTPLGGTAVTTGQILESTVYGIPNTGTVVSLQKLVRTSVSGTTQESWDSTVSTVPIPPPILDALPNVNASEVCFFCAGWGLCVVLNSVQLVYLSVSYRALSVQTVTQQYSYPLTSLFGDFAGMTGVSTLVCVLCAHPDLYWPAGILTGLHLSTMMFGIEKLIFKFIIMRRRRAVRAKSVYELPSIAKDGAVPATPSLEAATAPEPEKV